MKRNKNEKMLSLILDPIFKSLCLISSFIGHKQGVAIEEEYDKNFVFSLYS
jgi:hypothetical protein